MKGHRTFAALRGSAPPHDPLSDLQFWALARGWDLVVDLEPYQLGRIAGVVQRSRLDPRAGTIEVVVGDGTATATAVWALGDAVPQLGLVPARCVTLEGVTRRAEDGGILFVEPDFRIVHLPLGVAE